MNGHFLGKSYHFLRKFYHFWGSITTLGWPLCTISNPPNKSWPPPFLAMPRFWERLFCQPLPNGSYLLKNCIRIRWPLLLPNVFKTHCCHKEWFIGLLCLLNSGMLDYMITVRWLAWFLFRKFDLLTSTWFQVVPFCSLISEQFLFSPDSIAVSLFSKL